MTFEAQETGPEISEMLCDSTAAAIIAAHQEAPQQQPIIARGGESEPPFAEPRTAPTTARQQPLAGGLRGAPQATTARGKGRAKKTLGTMLRTRRRDLQLTQREVAAKLGVKPAHIAYLELDHRRPSLSLLSRIAEVLDLDRERLILLSHPEARSFITSARKAEPLHEKDYAWREFKNNKHVLNRYKVSKKELKVLSQVALLGRVGTPRSFLFILNSIRQAVEDEEV